MEKSKSEIPFLDILIKRDDEKIWMDLYHKPTDTRRCVPFFSNHPGHCKRNIPFCLARRIFTIVEKESDQEKHLRELNNDLKAQGYPETLIKEGFNKARAIPIDILRKAKTRDSENIIPFISTYNPNNPNLFGLIKSGFTTLCNTNVNGFSQELKLIQSERQSPNLKKILTKAEFTTKQPMVSKCGNKLCECCNHLVLSDHHIFKNSKTKFMLKTPITCDSSNLIYVIICPTCKEEYIGETGEGSSKLKDRVRIYRQHIRQPEYQQIKVEGHLRECGKGSFFKVIEKEIFPSVWQGEYFQLLKKKVTKKNI